jgi:hypothetical protein
MRHGLNSTYRNNLCRCSPCTEANRVAQAAYRAMARARAAEDPALVPHGTATGYVYWRCKCPACTEANRATKPARRAGAA